MDSVLLLHEEEASSRTLLAHQGAEDCNDTRPPNETNEAKEKELYDHDNDPLETINLAAKPEHKENVQHLSNKLREKIG